MGGVIPLSKELYGEYIGETQQKRSVTIAEYYGNACLGLANRFENAITPAAIVTAITPQIRLCSVGALCRFFHLKFQRRVGEVMLLQNVL